VHLFDPEGFFTVPSPAVCRDETGNVTSDRTLPDGGYLKLGTDFRTDTAANVTGTCLVRTWDPLFEMICRSWWTELVTLINVTLWTYPPTQPASYAFAPAPNGATSLDTRTGQGFVGSLSEVGTYRFTFKSSAFSTTCTPWLNSSIVERRLNAVSCLPTWRFVEGILNRFPVDGTDITVGYADNLDDAVRPAINAWNAKLAQWGLALHFEPTPGAGCAPIDAHCGSVGVMTSPDEPVVCGWRRSPPGVNGVYTQRSEVYLKPGWDSWTVPVQNGTIAHEFGHLLGLADAQNCDPLTSIMNPQTVCGGTTIATSPTDNDAMAVAKTVYQFGSRKTCG
jgi:hypothetical protein